MKGGAWPFLVGGVICLINFDNERDLDLLTSPDIYHFCVCLLKLPVCVVFAAYIGDDFLEGQSVSSRRKREAITGL